MYKKHYLRNKFLVLRKRKYFSVSFNSLQYLIKYLNNKKKGSVISLYYPSNFEFNIIKILSDKNLKNFKTLLPVIVNNFGMEFFEWKKGDILKVNTYGILEPINRNKNIVPDVILVPCLAFDQRGFRLGYGKGFYDRYLGKYLKKNKHIETIGVGFSFQKYKKIPTDKYDIRLNKIYTEKGFL